jgi:hypothetical protein
MLHYPALDSLLRPARQAGSPLTFSHMLKHQTVEKLTEEEVNAVAALPPLDASSLCGLTDLSLVSTVSSAVVQSALRVPSMKRLQLKFMSTTDPLFALSSIPSHAFQKLQHLRLNFLGEIDLAPVAAASLLSLHLECAEAYTTHRGGSLLFSGLKVDKLMHALSSSIHTLQTLQLSSNIRLFYSSQEAQTAACNLLSQFANLKTMQLNPPDPRTVTRSCFPAWYGPTHGAACIYTF